MSRKVCIPFVMLAVIISMSICIQTVAALSVMKMDGNYRINDPVKPYSSWLQGNQDPQVCSDDCLKKEECLACTYIFLPGWSSGSCYLYNTKSFQKDTNLMAGSTYVTYLKYVNTDQPIAGFGYSFVNSQFTAPATVQFYGGVYSTDSNGINTYAWDFGDNTKGQGETVSHVYQTAGTYTITLTVTDKGTPVMMGTTTRQITVNPSQPQNTAPVASFTLTQNQNTAPSSVTFDASASSDADGISSYAWNFGDGATGQGKTVSHTYQNAGTYTVTLTVMDRGTPTKTGTMSKPVTISCSGGLSSCSGACVNLQTNSQNCGSCGKVCSAGMTCQNGICSGGAGGCSGGLLSCSGVCKNLQFDEQNCGACGVQCSEANRQICYSGKCISCPSGGTYCKFPGGNDAICADLKTAPEHCGACNNHCPQGQTCQNGICSGAAQVQCTPPACKAGETLMCLEQQCPGGCGMTCVNPKEFITATCTPTENLFWGQLITFQGSDTFQESKNHLKIYGPGFPVGGVLFATPTVNPDDTWSYKWYDAGVPGYTVGNGDYEVRAWNSAETIYSKMRLLFNGVPPERVITTVYTTPSQVTIPHADFTAKKSTDPNSPPYTFEFDASSSSDPDGIVKYQWRFPNTLTQSTNSPYINHTFSVPGSYSVTLWVEDTTQQTASVIKSVTVNEISVAVPNVDFTAPWTTTIPATATPTPVFETAAYKTPLVEQIISGIYHFFQKLFGDTSPVDLHELDCNAPYRSDCPPYSCWHYTDLQTCPGPYGEYTSCGWIDEGDCGSCGHKCDSILEICYKGQCVPLNYIQASFTFTPSEGCAPLTVSFTDTSTTVPDVVFGDVSIDVSITKWMWDFDHKAGEPYSDSEERNPTHVYTEAGTYYPGLDIYNAYGHNYSISLQPITVRGNCGACGNACQPDQFCIAGQCSCGNRTNCNGVCVNTWVDNQNCGACGYVCQSGQTCQIGVCSGAAGGCGAGLSSCSGACKNLQTDSTNCGSCGNACEQGMGMTCSNGQCTYTFNPCAAGATYCNGNCIFTATNPSNCGSCGNVCPAGTICQNGVCTATGGCAAGLSSCSGTCKNLLTDSQNCGFCGQACPAGQVCSAGACAASGICGAGQMNCSGACVNTKIDSQNCGGCRIACSAGLSCCDGGCMNLQYNYYNCGSCGNVCPGGQMCSGGTCIANVPCPAGQRRCNGVCTDTQTDPNNCNGCGNNCPAALGCNHGVCVGARG